MIAPNESIAFAKPGFAPARTGVHIPLMRMALVGLLPGPVKRWYYRRQGAQIGRRVKLGLFSYIASPDLRIDDDVIIAPFTCIILKEHLHIGARSSVKMLTFIDTGSLSMGEDSAISEQVVIGGMLTPDSHVRIGSRTKIFPYCVINPTVPISIGDEVSVGGSTYLFTHSAGQSVLEGFPRTLAPITIENGAYLACRCSITPGVRIGEHALIGINSTVTRDIPARAMAAGSPARVIKQGHEYITQMDADRKHALLLDILKHYAEHLSYTGYPASLRQEDAHAQIDVHLDRTLRRVFYARRPMESLLPERNDIVISLERLDDEIRAGYDAQGTGWYDIAAKECNLIRHTLWYETREYLLAYGIRFAVCASPAT